MEIKETKTKMVAETGKVKVKLVRDTLIGGEIRQAGTEQEVTEAEASELCKSTPGVYTHSGYRLSEQAQRADMRKAVRV